MEIIPSRGVGLFRLGSCLSDVILYINQNGMQLRTNELTFDRDNPCQSDICVGLTDFGLRLRFDPISQRLRLIDVHNLDRVALSYCGQQIPPRSTLTSVYKIFGPTYPGFFDLDKRTYMLQYPGLCFAFDLQQHAAAVSEGIHTQSTTLPLLPDGSSPTATRIFIHSGVDVKAQPAPLPPVSEHSLYFQCVQVEPKKGMYFTKQKCFVGFQSFVQDCLADLGPPQNLMTKTADRMKIHGEAGKGHGVLEAEDVGDSSTTYRDYFLNYFRLGFDILIDGGTHRVKKIVLHTNVVQHPDFNIYRKCNFRIGPSPQPVVGHGEDEEGLANSTRQAALTIGPDAHWDEICKVFGACGRPMVNKGPEDNPFEPTLIYAFDGVLFEIMNNGYISGVTLLPS